MRSDTKRQILRDCRCTMGPAITAMFFHRLVSIAAPTLAAWLIGDMADYLLRLDKMAILSALPGFLWAVFLQVVGASLLELAMNLLLTRDGFRYDSLLMGKFIRLPLRCARTADEGSVLERMEDDCIGFSCRNQPILLAYPGVFLLYAAGLALLLRDLPAGYLAVILALSALPVLRSACLGRKKVRLEKALSEYNEQRKQLEQDFTAAADFSRGFGLKKYFLDAADRLFGEFYARTGKEKSALDAGTALLDFLCDHAAQLGALLLGAALVARGKLTMGALLSGFLMVPSLRQCCQYVKNWVTELPWQAKYVDRLAIFYAGATEDSPAAPPPEALDAENVSFSYSGTPVLENLDFHMDASENILLQGPNGCGKSTLLSLLAGLEAPDSGKICTGAPLSALRKAVALQEQNGAIFSGTVWENLFLPEEKRENAAGLLAEMAFEKPLNTPVTSGGGNLSPGERKKLLLVRSLLREAPFLLLDEPLNHLDAPGRTVLGRYLAGRTGILLVSHQEPDLPGLSFRPFSLAVSASKK